MADICTVQHWTYRLLPLANPAEKKEKKKKKLLAKGQGPGVEA